MKKIVSSLFLAATFILCSCTENKYKVSQVSCESITIDSVIGKNSNSELAEMIKTYKIQLDKEMNLVIGVSDQYMENGKPQSLLANLTADILLKAGAEYLKEPVDLAIMNNGGLRAPLKKGDITVGDIFRIFPFENAVSILYLKGEDIKGLFDTLAKQGGEGVAGCSVTFKDKKVKKLLVGGKPVVNDKIYKLVTIDYLAEGNSNLKELLNTVKRVDTGILLRDIMINYVEQISLQKKDVTSKIDDRAVIL